MIDAPWPDVLFIDAINIAEQFQGTSLQQVLNNPVKLVFTRRVDWVFLMGHGWNRADQVFRHRSARGRADAAGGTSVAGDRGAAASITCSTVSTSPFSSVRRSRYCWAIG
jgi:hypothetical protein